MTYVHSNKRLQQFALTLELFAEAIGEESIDNGQIMLVVCPSAIFGGTFVGVQYHWLIVFVGCLYIFLNRAVNNWGSFLRKISTKTSYLSTLPAVIAERLTV